jgi:hypothetical protein
MLNKEETFEKLMSIMPDGWEAKAEELGAFKRGRQIKTGADLLRLNLLYQTEGKSCGGTAALLNLSGRYKITKKAVYTRIINSVSWLRWLCENIYRRSKDIIEKPEWLGEKDVYLVDASDEPVYGSKKADYRLHYAINLFDLGMKEMHLTETKVGERLGNFVNFGKGDVVIGDRGYCSIKGIEHILSSGADYLIRYGTNRFNLYDEERNGVDVLKYFEGLAEGESSSVCLYYVVNKSEYKPVKICAIRKTEEAEAEGLRKLEETNKRKGRQGPSEAQRAYNRYVIIITSLEGTEASVLMELYRQRWQIELVFKRLKSLFGYNEIPVKKEQSAQAWFYGKLLLAAICETWGNKGRFSPCRQSNGGSSAS